MTEKQLLKLDGKRVRFTFREHKYDVKSEVLEGYIDVDTTTIYLPRNGQLRPYKHYGFWLENSNKQRWIEFNQLKNISNLEVLD